MMKRLLIFFMGISSLGAKGDTIDYWHVYHNKTLVGNFSSTGVIKLKANQIHRGDSLRIEYFDDMGTGWKCSLPIEPVDLSTILFKGVDSTGGVTCLLNDELVLKPNNQRLIFKLKHYMRDSKVFKIALFYLRIE